MNNVISAKVKFNRNLKGVTFTTNSTKQELSNSLKLCLKAVSECGFKGETLDNLSPQVIENLILSETIENDFVNDYAQKAYATSNQVNIQINGKNHIEIFSVDKHVFGAYEKAKEVDKKLCNKLNFAYSDKFGFLSPNIKSVGSGMSVEYQIMLPALNKMKAINAIPKSNEKLIFDIKCIDDKSGLCVVKTSSNLGYTEKQICELTHQYIEKINGIEIEMAKTLLKEDEDEIVDANLRARAILNNCIKIDKNEVVELVSNILIGINCGIEKEININKVIDILNISKKQQIKNN